MLLNNIINSLFYLYKWMNKSYSRYKYIKIIFIFELSILWENILRNKIKNVIVYRYHNHFKYLFFIIFYNKYKELSLGSLFFIFQ
jgi:hypothetical protein